MGRGHLLSLDAALAAAILALMLSILLFQAQSHAQGQEAMARRAEKIFLAASVSEALVKNRNAQNPSLGSAYYNAEKRRVEANVIDPQLLGRAGRLGLGNYFLAGIYKRDGGENSYFFREGGKNCAVAERFVAFAGPVRTKAIVGAEICEH